jgi:hypothetical protein
MKNRIHWKRVVAGGFLAEAALFALVIPVYRIWGQHPLLYVVPPGAFVACFLLGLWVGRPLDSRFILHGALVGVVATLIYVALTLGRPEPVAYLLAHGLKTLGGAAGCAVAGRRTARIAGNAS